MLDRTGANQEVNESYKDEIYEMKKKLEASRLEQDRLRQTIHSLQGRSSPYRY